MIEALKEFWINDWQKIVKILAVAIFGLIIIKITTAILRRIFNKTHLENIVSSFIVSTIKVLLVLIYFIAILSMLGVPTTSLIALLSAAGLAISLALQQTLSNLASGFIIITSKPFVEGDYVEIGSSAGSVQTISIIHTILKTPDNRKIIIPNGVVTTSNIINYSTNPNRRLEIIVSVAYGTNIEFVKGVLKQTVSAHEKVLDDPAPFVRLKETGNSSLDFTVRVWVAKENFWAVNFDLREQIVTALQDNNIEIPFNQLGVTIKK